MIHFNLDSVRMPTFLIETRFKISVKRLTVLKNKDFLIDKILIFQ